MKFAHPFKSARTWIVISMGVATVLSTLLACSHNKAKYEPGAVTASNESGSKGGLKAEVLWVKNKPNNMDIYMRLTNQYDRAIVFKYDAMKLALNKEQGSLHSSNFTGSLSPGQMSEQLTQFRFIEKANRSGNAILTIDTISTDPTEGAKKSLPPLKISIPLKE